MDYLNLQDEVYLQEKINEEFSEYPDDTLFTEMNFSGIVIRKIAQHSYTFLFRISLGDVMSLHFLGVI